MDVDPDLHVLVQNAAPAAGKDNSALPDPEGEEIFLLLGSSAS